MRHLLVVAFVATFCKQAVGLSAFLYLSVHHSGFHRDIHYNVKFGGVGRMSCELLLIQQFPAAMYVDTDQLTNMKKFKKFGQPQMWDFRHFIRTPRSHLFCPTPSPRLPSSATYRTNLLTENNLAMAVLEELRPLALVETKPAIEGQINSYVPLYVDVEKPASKSSPFSVYLFETVRREVNITLPIHFRYHDPSERKFERIQIESPSLHLQCSRGVNGKSHPLKGSETHRFPCASSAQIYDYDKLDRAEHCDWQEVEFSNVPTVISVLIPVGNSASYRFVLPATILFSWIGSIYLIYIIVKSGKRVNKKLL